MKYLLIVVLVALLSTARSQIIHVYENVKDEMVELTPNGSNIVDINCRLEVKLQQDSLIKKLSKSAGINDKLLSKVENLNSILISQIEILKTLDSSMVGAETPSEQIQRLGIYSILMSKLLKKLQKSGNEEFRELANHYLKSYNGLRNADKINLTLYPTRQVYMIKKLFEYAQEVLKMMGETEDTQKFKFQLVAYLNTRTEYQRKVHIENFDNYAAGEYYEVERFVTSFSDTDIAEFNKTGDLAKSLNQMIDERTLSLQKLLQTNFQTIDCIRNMTSKIEAVEKDSSIKYLDDQQRKYTEALLNNFQSKFTALDAVLSQLNNTNQEGKNENILVLFNNYQNKFASAATLFSSSIETIKKNDQTIIVRLPDDIKVLISQFDTCMAALKQDSAKVAKIINVASGMLAPFKETADIASQVADKALNFGIDQFPETGYINLKTAGKRRNGDELVIRVKVRSKDEIDKNLPGETIEMRTLVIQQIKIYSISKVTLILAVPYANSNVKLLEENSTQFAPSGSLLFKFGSRESRTWNFISPGLGFNISTPDFNLDGTPDVGLGIIATVLKDIVSIGWSYNTTTNSPYWFVGLSIPVTLPGIPINNVQSKNID